MSVTEGAAIRAVVRAAQICDPEGKDSAVAALSGRVPFHDTETPMAIQDLRTGLAEAVRAIDPDGDSPALAMTAATSAYLACRHSERSLDENELLRRAALEEFRGAPPGHVADWLAARGVLI
jgi:hypothetical protein